MLLITFVNEATPATTPAIPTAIIAPFTRGFACKTAVKVLVAAEATLEATLYPVKATVPIPKVTLTPVIAAVTPGCSSVNSENPSTTSATPLYKSEITGFNCEPIVIPRLPKAFCILF